MTKVSFNDFTKLELRIGKVIGADEVADSEKLLKLDVDFGEERKQVISGIAKFYSPDDLIGKEFVFVTNLEPRNIMGLESQAMILAADVAGEAVCLAPNKEVPPGTNVR